MVDIIECPICNSKTLEPFISCKDFTVSHETFNIQKCSKCQLAVTTPRPELNKLGNYYESKEYISHSGKSSGGVGFLYRAARAFALSWKKKIVSKDGKKSALDFGCGTGEFLNTLKQAGWNAEGVEPSDMARSKAENLSGQKIAENLSAYKGREFDIITAWHVIEHVPELSQTIETLKSLLKKDGTIFIAVPNYQSPDAEFYREYWAGFDVPRHLWHFSKKSMVELLHAKGLTVTDIRPMKLDAFYVSMLSEKYKAEGSSLSGMLNGFFSGLKSNTKARKPLNHSSLIYIAKHT